MTELLLVVGIIGVVIALLLPAAGRFRRKGVQVRCLSNLKQISAASASYSVDHRGGWPPNEVIPSGNRIFSEFLLPYLGPVPRRPSAAFRESVFVCPADRTGEPDGNWRYKGVYCPMGLSGYGLSYGQNANLQKTTARARVGFRRNTVALPSELVLYMDFANHYTMDAYTLGLGKRTELLEPRHDGWLNAAFADGSVRTVRLKEIPSDAPVPFWQGRRE